ncbi:hypothetical protein S245_044014, partial [Arachis hypogaea]
TTISPSSFCQSPASLSCLASSSPSTRKLCHRFSSASHTGILNKIKLVAIDAGNRGYPPNKLSLKLNDDIEFHLQRQCIFLLQVGGLSRVCCGKIQSLGKHLLHILSSTPRHPNLIEHTSEKAKEAKDIQ